MHGYRAWVTYSNGVGQKHDGHDQQEARDVCPRSLQGGGDEVQFGIEPQQVPQLYGGQENQEGDQVAQHCIRCSSLMETGVPNGEEVSI